MCVLDFYLDLVIHIRQLSVVINRFQSLLFFESGEEGGMIIVVLETRPVTVELCSGNIVNYRC